MNKTKKLLSAFVVLAFAALVALAPLSAPIASAATCGKDVSGKPIQTTIDFGSSSALCNADGASPITAILLWAINILAGLVGLAVIVGIVFGGITYAASDGDASKAKQGQEIIVNAVIGLVLFIFMYAAAQFLVPGGAFK